MGHGWVTPNADGSKARCGGPGFCRECSAEAGRPWCADGEHEWVSPGGQGLAEGERICTKCGQLQRPGPCPQGKQELAGSLIITGIDADKASREEWGMAVAVANEWRRAHGKPEGNTPISRSEYLDKAFGPQGCWPPHGTPDGTVHVLYQDFGDDYRVWEYAKWHADTQSWTRWLTERPTGDFACLCRATYAYPVDKPGIAGAAANEAMAKSLSQNKWIAGAKVLREDQDG